MKSLLKSACQRTGFLDFLEFFLSLFKTFGVTGTFFSTAESMAMYPKLMTQILEDGHELASHSYTHYHSSDRRPKDSGVINHLSGDRLEREIAMAFECGEKFGIFRYFSVIDSHAPGDFRKTGEEWVRSRIYKLCQYNSLPARCGKTAF